MPEHTHLGLARTDEANLEHPNAEKHSIEITSEGQYETTALRVKFGRPLQQVRGSSRPRSISVTSMALFVGPSTMLARRSPRGLLKNLQLLTMFRCAHTHTHCSQFLENSSSWPHSHVKDEQSMTHNDKHYCWEVMDEWMHRADIQQRTTETMNVFGCVNSYKRRLCHHKRTATQLYKKELQTLVMLVRHTQPYN